MHFPDTGAPGKPLVPLLVAGRLGTIMTVNLEHLESLARLSKGASPEGRQELLREVTDMFMGSPPKQLSPKEVEYFGDIMDRLVFELEMKVRQHLAETLSSVGEAPLDLVKKLANDEIEVARPILTKSGVLKDSDLLEVVKMCSQEHLQAVSMREKVSGTVADALVEKGNDTVLGTLASNEGAELSKNAIETMVERSEGGDEVLQGALVKRSDLPKELKKKMFDYVSEALREHILASDADIDESQIDGLMAETEDWLESEEGGGEGLTDAEKFILRKEQLNQLDTKLLMKLAHDGKLSEFIAGVSRLLKIDLPTAQKAVFDATGEKLAVVCKALDFDSIMFSQIVGLLDSDNKLDAEDKKMLVGVYGRITPNSAQRALRFLRTRKKLKKGGRPEMSWG